MPVQGFARAEQIPDIRRVWLKSFPEDTAEVVDTFLERVDITEECLIYCEDGRPVSVAFLLPLTLQLGDVPEAVQYIYAAGTDPAYRRRGIFGKLLRAAMEVGKERGQIASCLQPASEKLEQYYAAFGYHTFFQVYRVQWTRQELEAHCAAKQALTEPGQAPGCYARLRDRRLSGRPAYVRWEPRFTDYTVDWAMRSGGGVLVRKDISALLEPVGDTLLVRELLCDDRDLPYIYRTLYDQFPYPYYDIIHPARADKPITATGMWCPLSLRGEELLSRAPGLLPYMGLTLA